VDPLGKFRWREGRVEGFGCCCFVGGVVGWGGKRGATVLVSIQGGVRSRNMGGKILPSEGAVRSI